MSLRRLSISFFIAFDPDHIKFDIKCNLKVIYKGFEIEVKREQALGGWDNLYFSAYRLLDGWCLEESFTEGDDKVSDYIGYMKELVDSYLKNPEDQEDG